MENVRVYVFFADYFSDLNGYENEADRHIWNFKHTTTCLGNSCFFVSKFICIQLTGIKLNKFNLLSKRRCFL